MSGVLEVKKIAVDFKGFKAVDGIDLCLEEGEVRVIIGPNGAGKSTLIDLITVKTKSKTGKVVFKGKEITNKPPYEISGKYGIGRKFQGPNVFGDMTVYENIELALRGHNTVRKTFAYRRSAKIREEVESILEEIGLYEQKNRVVKFLSHGEKQWVEMGMVLAQRPELIILDEPTTGMTAQETAKTGEMILKMAGKHTVIVSEHDMDFVRQIAKKVTVLHQGRVLAEGMYDEIVRNPQVIKVYLKSDVEEGE